MKSIIIYGTGNEVLNLFDDYTLVSAIKKPKIDLDQVIVFTLEKNGSTKFKKAINHFLD